MDGVFANDAPSLWFIIEVWRVEFWFLAVELQML
jgi:hypothetical protein